MKHDLTGPTVEVKMSWAQILIIRDSLALSKSISTNDGDGWGYSESTLLDAITQVIEAETEVE